MGSWRNSLGDCHVTESSSCVPSSMAVETTSSATGRFCGFYVGGMVLEEFQNMMLYIYICVDSSFLNGLQKSTDRIFRLSVPALLAASG